MVGKRNAAAASAVDCDRHRKRRETKEPFHTSTRAATTPRRVTRSMTAAQRAKERELASASRSAPLTETELANPEVPESLTTPLISDVPSPSLESSSPTPNSPPKESAVMTTLPLPSSSSTLAALTPFHEPSFTPDITTFGPSSPAPLPLPSPASILDTLTDDWVVMEDAPMNGFPLDDSLNNELDYGVIDSAYFPPSHQEKGPPPQIDSLPNPGISSGGSEAWSSKAIPGGVVFSNPFSSANVEIAAQENEVDNSAATSPRTALPGILPLPTLHAELYPISHHGYRRLDRQLPQEHYDGDTYDETLPSIQLAAFHHSTGNEWQSQTTAPLPWVGDVVELAGGSTFYDVNRPFSDILAGAQTTDCNAVYNVSRPLENILANLAPEVSMHPHGPYYAADEASDSTMAQFPSFSGAPVAPIPDPVNTSPLPPWRMPQGSFSPQRRPSVWNYDAQILANGLDQLYSTQDELPIDQPWLAHGDEFNRANWEVSDEY